MNKLRHQAYCYTRKAPQATYQEISDRRASLTSIRRFTVLKLSSDRVSSLAAHAAGGSRGGILMAGLPSDAGRSMSARL